MQQFSGQTVVVQFAAIGQTRENRPVILLGNQRLV